VITVEWADRLPAALADDMTHMVETSRCAYPHSRILVAARRRGVAGVWVVPTDHDGEGWHARRADRALPYTAPVLLESHPQRRRDVMVQMLRLLQGTFTSLELPMTPGFRDATCCRQLGIAAEWRHTHILDLRGPWREGYSPTIKQHLRAAGASATCRREEVDAFHFDRALVAQPESQRRSRREFAARAAATGAVTCLAAVAGHDVVGQALTLRAADTSILLHAWFERCGPRGIPTLLIDAAADSGHRDGRRRLDLEGSVLPGVDYFMSGFGGETVPYPYLYWHRDPPRHTALIMGGIAAGTEPNQ
jgi:hypothetical protein